MSKTNFVKATCPKCKGVRFLNGCKLCPKCLGEGVVLVNENAKAKKESQNTGKILTMEREPSQTIDMREDKE